MSGRYSFASGIHHANKLLCACQVMDNHGPRLTSAGTPETRMMLLPAEVATIFDTWSVVGMCGTGSNDFVVEDVFVPSEDSLSVLDPPQESGPLYHPRLFFVVLWTSNAANALGIARGEMDTFIEMANQVGSTGSTTLLRDRPLVQTTVAEAEAIINGARAYLLDAVATVWQAIRNGESDPSSEVAHARLAITHAIRESVRAVDLLFNAAGTNAIYRKIPWNDIFGISTPPSNTFQECLRTSNQRGRRCWVSVQPASDGSPSPGKG